MPKIHRTSQIAFTARKICRTFQLPKEQLRVVTARTLAAGNINMDSSNFARGLKKVHGMPKVLSTENIENLLKREGIKLPKPANGDGGIDASARAKLRALFYVSKKYVDSIEENREVVCKGIIKSKLCSAVRAYDVNLEEGTWHEKYTLGDPNRSSYADGPQVSVGNEKAFLTRLLKREANRNDVMNSKKEGVYKWREGEYLYIPKRSKCDFVDKGQLERDEQVYGKGMAEEVFYLIIGSKSDKTVEIYMMTNWAANKKEDRNIPLFGNAKEDINLITALKSHASIRRMYLMSLAHERKLVAENKELATKDKVTNIHNRTYFEDKLEDEFDRAKRFGQTLSVIAIDLHNFDHYNNEGDHDSGDHILKTFASLVGSFNGTMEKEDEKYSFVTNARVGGDEFYVILPNTSSIDARQYAKRLYEYVRSNPAQFTMGPFSGRSFNIECRMGVATYLDGGRKLIVKDDEDKKRISINSVADLRFAADHGERIAKKLMAADENANPIQQLVEPE